ncbi:alpha-E domain-containing protein, partial [Methylobacterium radiotolerans]|uniref:alpha-E domain-containing protein n=1 Tax=Methylobacterium radiotolerans TaxID=31998 RepID=UPI001FD97D99
MLRSPPRTPALCPLCPHPTPSRSRLPEGGAASAAALPTARLAQGALSGRDRSGSARSHILAARRNAAALRARLSGEAWRVLADLNEFLSLDPERAFTESQLAGRAERALSQLAAPAGLTPQKLSRAEGRACRSVERRWGKEWSKSGSDRGGRGHYTKKHTHPRQHRHKHTLP